MQFDAVITSRTIEHLLHQTVCARPTSDAFQTHRLLSCCECYATSP